MKSLLLLTAAMTVALSSWSANADAQTSASPAVSSAGLGDVVVTARRKQEKLQSVPVAVSVLDEEALSNKGTYSPLTLQQTVPGFRATITTSGNDSLIFNIRGQSQSAQTLFPAVIPYYAETPQLRGFALGQFFDLENIQVLRGPQGVRFGRVTTGGAILVSPRKPGEEFGGYIRAQVGDYSAHALEGAINIPIVADKVLFRAAFDVNRRDGYTKNLITGKNLDDVNYDSSRVSLIVRPFEGLENYTTAQYQTINSNGISKQNIWLTPGTSAGNFPGYAAAFAAQQAYGPRTVANGGLQYGPNGGIHFMQQTLFLSNVTTYQLNDTFSFKNVFGYATQNIRQGTDADGTPVVLVDLVNRYLPAGQQHQISEEFQVNGKFFDDRLNATLGVYYDQQKPTHRWSTDYVVFASLIQSNAVDVTTDSKAVYGSFEYDLRDFIQGLKLNGGMRYTKDKGEGETATYAIPIAQAALVPYGICTTFGTQPCIPTNFESSATTWEAGATYQATRDIFLYASGRRGYRGGGFSATVLNPAFRLYRPEFDTEVELGVKADWTIAGMKARTNLALFRDKIKGIQRGVSFVAGGTTQAFRTNVSGATMQGIELESKLVPFEGLTLAINYALTDARFDRFATAAEKAIAFNPVNGICNPTAPGRPAAGEPIFCPYNAFQVTPKHQASFIAKYTLPLADSLGEISIGGDYNYQSRQTYNDVTFAADPVNYQKAYAIVNLNLTWENVFQRPVDLSFFVTNLTDVLYRTSQIEQGQRSSAGYNTVTYGEPRMYGASLKYRFGADANN